MTYGVPVLMANRVGSEQDLGFWGGSTIVDHFGTVIAEADGQREELLTAELHYDMVRRARFQLPTLRDSNLDLIHREIADLAARSPSDQPEPPSPPPPASSEPRSSA